MGNGIQGSYGEDVGISNKLEESLVSSFTDPVPGERTFEIFCRAAQSQLLDTEQLWLMVAREEIKVNACLLHLELEFDSVDTSSSPTTFHQTWHYRIKVARHLIFAAKLEALSGQRFDFYFYPEYARHIYPKLLSSLKANPIVQRYMQSQQSGVPKNCKTSWHKAKLKEGQLAFECPASIFRCVKCGEELDDKRDASTDNIDAYVCASYGCEMQGVEHPYGDILQWAGRMR